MQVVEIVSYHQSESIELHACHFVALDGLKIVAVFSLGEKKRILKRIISPVGLCYSAEWANVGWGSLV